MTTIHIILALVLFVTMCFTFVLLFGAPFLPTLKPQIKIALDMLDLQPGQTMLELGCGDGRVLIAAAKRGINGVGYELNPIMVLIARIATWRYRRQIKIVWGNFWRAQWPESEGIFGFILPKYMSKLHKKVVQYPSRPLKVVSFAFAIPDKKPAKSSKGVFLYVYE